MINFHSSVVCVQVRIPLVYNIWYILECATLKIFIETLTLGQSGVNF